ncbi:MAG: retroviral-like aspartic protease family protein [Defluviitaleaceae bacterium]|nr:retroviral-like aspartic protease family protein [Defluviitaleaceae bacterium]
MERDKFTVDFTKHGRAFLRLDIKPEYDSTMRPVRMKVDTGADFTTLSKITLASLGYDNYWIQKNAITGKKYNLSTAAGDEEEVGLIQLPVVNLLQYEAFNWPFRVILSKERDFRNLLGRDLLAGFDYTFRNSSWQFEISRIGKFTPIYEFIKGQSINEVII